MISPERAVNLGFTGAMLRGSGVEWDLRKKQPYSVYGELDFDIPIGVNGDCYDRYLVRVEEMRQSNKIIKQCIDWLRANPGPVMTDDKKVSPPQRIGMKDDMEAELKEAIADEEKAIAGFADLKASKEKDTNK